MTDKKSDLIKSIMTNLGILLILISTLAAKDQSIPFFILGLILLSIQVLELKSIAPRNLVTAEIIIAAALAVVSLVQLIMARSFAAPQVFTMLLLLGSILILVEAVRKYADL